MRASGARGIAMMAIVACGSRSARDDASVWEARWQAARTCLAAGGTGTAAQRVATRLVDGARVAPCTRELAAVETIGLDTDAQRAVAKAAMELSRAARELAHATRRPGGPAPDGSGSATEGAAVPRGPGEGLVTAIERLETARLAYLAEAGVDRGDDPPLPAATMVALPGVIALGPLPIPSAGGAVLFGNTRATGIEIVLPTGGAPRVSPVRVGVLRSPGEPAMGIVAEIDRARVGIIDDAGKMSDLAMPMLEITEHPTDPADRRTSALVAIGTSRDGAFAMASKTTLVLALAHPARPPDMHEVYDPDDPRLALDAVTLSNKLGDVAFATDPGGRASLVWRDDDGAIRGALLVPGKPPQIHELAHGTRLGNETCFAGDRAWARAGDYLVDFSDRLGTPVPMPTFHVVACGARGVVLRDGDQAFACTDRCASAPVPASGDVLALIDGRIERIAIRAGVLAIGSRHYAAPGALHAELAMSDDRTTDVLAQTRDGYVVVRVANPTIKD